MNRTVVAILAFSGLLMALLSAPSAPEAQCDPDTTPPGVTCPANITVNSCMSEVVNYVAGASDSCGLASFVCTPTPGSTFPIGTTTATCTAVDLAGLSASCSFNVTVADTQPPVITCPANITVSNDPNQCGAVVSFVATATDNCSVMSLVATPVSGSFFPVGTTTVTGTATDPSGNTATCNFTVTVVDTQPPVITCPANITTPNDHGQNGAIVNFPVPTATDNCSVMSLVANPASGSFFPVGTTTVTATATDPSGNTATCTFNATVNLTEVTTVPTLTEWGMIMMSVLLGGSGIYLLRRRRAV